jgi:hypothetical protein
MYEINNTKFFSNKKTEDIKLKLLYDNEKINIYNYSKDDNKVHSIDIKDLNKIQFKLITDGCK